MPLKRRHIRISAAIALVALAVFVVLWIGARTELARGMVARAITDSIGLPTKVESLKLGFFPSPSVDIGGLAIAQPPGFGDEPFLAVGRLRLSVPWGRLFRRNTLNTVDITDATARLIVGSDGVANWSKVGDASSTASSPTVEDQADWLVRVLDLERGTIDYRDLSSKARWQLAGIGLTVQELAPAVEFPLDLRLGGVFGPNTIHYAMKGRGRLDPDAGKYEASALDIRGWAGGDPLPLAGVELTGALERATYESGSGRATLAGGHFKLAGIPGTFDGEFDVDEPALDATLRVKTEPFAPRAPAVSFGRALPVTTDPAAFESLQVALEAHLQDGELTLDPFSGRLDDTNFEGRIVPGRRLVRASLDRIDLNRYVPPTDKTLPKKKATLEAVVAELATYDLDAELRIGEARISGVNVRDLLIRVERDGEHTP
jgi:AsmA protein